MMRRRHCSLLVCLLVLATACERRRDSAAHGGGGPSGWLVGTVDERFELVSKHLRGFDMAMVEVGHRYTELYWAGRDRNWEYAEYQLSKIETAVANGVERRPARAGSAKMLGGAVSAVREAVRRRDTAAMDGAFASLTVTCNACHHAERVPFISIETPSVRPSPVHFAPAAGTSP